MNKLEEDQTMKNIYKTVVSLLVASGLVLTGCATIATETTIIPGRELNRTTSTLTVGTPVDVSPYILNNQSIVSVPSDNGWQQLDYIQRQLHLQQQRRRQEQQRQMAQTLNQAVSTGAISASTATNLTTATNVINITGGVLGVAFLAIQLIEAGRDYRYYEFDVEVSFEDSGRQRHSFQITGAACEKYKNRAKKKLDEDLKREVAKLLYIDPDNKRDMKNLRRFNVRTINSRVGDAKFDNKYSAVFYQETEPGFYQFDVEVGYEKTSTTKKQESTYDVFDKIYRSNLRTLGAASIDVQHCIWDDAVNQGHKKTPMPIVNFVKTLKVLPEQNIINFTVSTPAVQSQDILNQTSATLPSAEVQSQDILNQTSATLPLAEVQSQDILNQTSATLPSAMDGYFNITGGQPSGPNTFEDLVLLARHGILTKNSLVWKEGMAQWVMAGDIEEFNTVFSLVPPPLPPY